MIIAFLAHTYIMRMNESETNAHMACLSRQKNCNIVVPLILEAKYLLDPKAWYGKVQFRIGGEIYIDNFSATAREKNIDSVGSRIIETQLAVRKSKVFWYRNLSILQFFVTKKI